MKAISASEIVRLLDPEATVVSIRLESGEPFGEFSVDQLKALTEAGYVVGVATGRGKLRQIRLTVPPTQATRVIGDTGTRIKDIRNSDASKTTVKEPIKDLAPIIQHHKQHCEAWPHIRTAAQLRTIRQLLRSDQNFAEMAKSMICLYPDRPILDLAGSLTELEPHLAAKAKHIIELYRDPAMTVDTISAEMHLGWGDLGKVMAALSEPMRLPHGYHPPIQQLRTIENGTEIIASVEQGIPRLRAFRFEMEEKEPPRKFATVIGDGGFKALIPIPSAEFNRYANAPNATVTVLNGQTHIHLHDVSKWRESTEAAA
jgi:hypothetical protein